MTSREARIYKYEEPWGLGWRNLTPVFKIKLHIGYSCKLSLKINEWDFSKASRKNIEDKKSSGQDSMGSHCILRVLWPEASCFLSKKSRRFASCAYASNWCTPMVQIHEMSEQIRIEWLQFQHRNSTCRLTSCPHVMFQKAYPSVPVPPDVWKALWSLKPPAMSKRRLGSRPKGVRKVVKPFTLVEVLAAIFVSPVSPKNKNMFSALCPLPKPKIDRKVHWHGFFPPHTTKNLVHLKITTQKMKRKKWFRLKPNIFTNMLVKWLNLQKTPCFFDFSYHF